MRKLNKKPVAGFLKAIGAIENKLLDTETEIIKTEQKNEHNNGKKDPIADSFVIGTKKVVISDQTRANQVISDQTRANQVISDQTRAKGGHIGSSVGDILVLDHLVKNEKENGLIFYNYAEIGTSICKTYHGAKKSVQRLEIAGFIERLTSKNTGRGGGFIVKVTNKGYEEWNDRKLIAWAVLKSKKVVISDQTGPIDKIRSDKNLILSIQNCDPGWWKVGWDKIPGSTEKEIQSLVAEILTTNKSRTLDTEITIENVRTSLELFGERCKKDDYLSKLKSPVAIFKKELLESASGIIKADGATLVNLKKKQALEALKQKLSNEEREIIIKKMRSFPGWELISEEICLDEYFKNYGIKPNS